jgi:hypothetical protein
LNFEHLFYEIFDIWPDNFYIYATKKSTLKTVPQDIFPASFSGKPHGIVSGLVFYGILENKKK